METLFEIIKIILPAIITGMITFLITKYTYNNNRPVDKLEIAYNKIYYPLSKIIKNENIDSVIDISKFYINRYYKYVDYSTLKAFRTLCKCDTNTKKKEAYQIFKDNIYNRSSYLRRRLGYLEPSFLQMYTYSTKSEKSTIRILFELLGVYLFVFIGNLFTGNVQGVLICIAFVILIIMIIELIYKFAIFLWYKIKK